MFGPVAWGRFFDATSSNKILVGCVGMLVSDIE